MDNQKSATRNGKVGVAGVTSLHLESATQKLSTLEVNLDPWYYNFVHYFPPLDLLPRVRDDTELTTVLAENEDKVGLYIHIPFCASACRFCYYSKRVRPPQNTVDLYLRRLETECQIYSKFMSDTKIHSVYVGGGTPSYMDPVQIGYVLSLIKEYFDLSEQVEFTFEVEPHTFDQQKLDILVACGVDRISMGVQSLDDRILVLHNRAHSSKEAIVAINLLRESGIRTYNLDFMYGLKGQELSDVTKSLGYIDRILPPSVTFYQLWFVSFGSRPPEPYSERGLPLKAIIAMKQAIAKGMNSLDYNVNNQCWYIRSDDDGCKHFSDRWCGGAYIGLGQAAYGYVGGCAYQNTKSLSEYCEKLECRKLPIAQFEKLSDEEKATRDTILILKTNQGVSINDVQNKFDLHLRTEKGERIRRLIDLGVLEESNGKLRFSSFGLLWGDSVLSSFMTEVMYEKNTKKKQRS